MMLLSEAMRDIADTLENGNLDAQLPKDQDVEVKFRVKDNGRDGVFSDLTATIKSFMYQKDIPLGLPSSNKRPRNENGQD